LICYAHGMARLDARKLEHATLEEIRIRAVQQVQAGESPEAVIRVLGFSSRCIYSWLAMYRAGGWDALKAKPGALSKISPVLLGRISPRRWPSLQVSAVNSWWFIVITGASDADASDRAVFDRWWYLSKSLWLVPDSIGQRGSSDQWPGVESAAVRGCAHEIHANAATYADIKESSKRRKGLPRDASWRRRKIVEVFTPLPATWVMSSTDDVGMNGARRTFDRRAEAIVVRAVLEADEREASDIGEEGWQAFG
jgi:Helix-turn-helix domain